MEEYNEIMELQKKIKGLKVKVKYKKKNLTSQIGKNIVKYRKEKGLTQDELANMIGETRASLANKEVGISIGSVATFLLICDVLGVTPNDMIR